MPAPPAPNRPTAWAWLLLGVMTLAAFGGPFGIWTVLKGGERAEWPPDRLIEWVVFAGVCSLVVALMLVSGALLVRTQREVAAGRAAADDAKPEAGP